MNPDTEAGSEQDRSEQEVFEGQSYEGETIAFDGKTFRNCTFRDCTFEYRGGQAPIFIDCVFGDIHVVWGREAANTIQTLATIASLGEDSEEGMRKNFDYLLSHARDMRSRFGNRFVSDEEEK